MRGRCPTLRWWNPQVVDGFRPSAATTLPGGRAETAPQGISPLQRGCPDSQTCLQYLTEHGTGDAQGQGDSPAFKLDRADLPSLGQVAGDNQPYHLQL